MTTPASPDHAEPWYLLGAGNMGLLAAHYLQRAGFTVIALRRDDAPILERTLILPSGEAVLLHLDCQSIVRAGPAPTIRRLVVACKAPFSAAALGGLPLAADATVLRLQNGLGSLDGRLPAGARMIEVVSASAVKRDGDAHRVVAENDTWMGDGTPPAWFGTLAGHWPKLHWPPDFRHRQWRKLVGNAVINPLTGLHDVANGHIFEDPALAAEAEQLAREADRVLTTLDPTWPGDSLPGVRALAEATAGNTSSMRADMQAGAITEIDAINGWLLRQADVLGLDLPAHRRLVAAVKARHP
ncbi:ketopantoate reductase family protein [Alloalcanivorax venustensis]|uniref:ketopantoate reductase family protein n=1 Tax=Alloalcanivorax venustensis TaxID=172371 RepID=UPI0032980773